MPNGRACGGEERISAKRAVPAIPAWRAVRDDRVDCAILRSLAMRRTARRRPQDRGSGADKEDQAAAMVMAPCCP
jgi:hypothetical protein